jgi:acetylglutamate/LysW-gamma-L-alpha-aminoadipate kinase
VIGTTVVKCCRCSAEQAVATCWDVADLAFRRHRVVLVHDAGEGAHLPSTGRARSGHAAARSGGVATAPVSLGTLHAGALDLFDSSKSDLLTALGSAGVEAVGLTGLDAGLLRARRRNTVQAQEVRHSDSLQDACFGALTQVNSRVLTALLDVGVVPVVSPPALAQDGTPVNVSSDHVAAAVAVALRATTLVLLVSKTRLPADPADLASVLEQTSAEECPQPGDLDDGRAGLLTCAREALERGVGRVVVADSCGARPVTRALNGHGADLRPGSPPGATAPPEP